MGTALAVIPATQSGPAELVESAERVQTYLSAAQSRNTIRGYKSSFAQFEAWCHEMRLASLPGESKS